MKKHNFLSALLKSDFIIAEKVHSSTSKRPKFLVPNLSLVQIELKLLIKTLMYIKKHGGFLTVLISDLYTYELLNTLVINAQLQKKIILVLSDQHIPTYTSIHTLLILDRILINERFCTRNFHKKINIVSLFKLNRTSKATKGFYKIGGNSENHERLIFIFLLLKNCLS